MLAHAQTPSDTVGELCFVAAGALGWISVARLRGRGFPRLPVAGAWAAAALSLGAIVAGVVVPSVMSPPYASVRPHSPAKIEILQPTWNEVVRGDRMRVDLELMGGRITPLTSTTLTPTTGHLHVYIDGRLLAMTTTADQVVDISAVSDGEHLLEADFVAADHGPFDPPVMASVPFDKEG
jgi:hypothetical protein